MEERVLSLSDLNLLIQQALLTAGCGIGLLAFLALLASAHPTGLLAPLVLGAMSTVAFASAGLLTLRARSRTAALKDPAEGTSVRRIRRPDVPSGWIE
jgi:hypothetical protein